MGERVWETKEDVGSPLDCGIRGWQGRRRLGPGAEARSMCMCPPEQVSLLRHPTKLPADSLNSQMLFEPDVNFYHRISA